MSKFHLWLHGGLGDVIYRYLFGIHTSWSRLKDYKEKNPNSKIKAFVICHNPQSTELIKYNPYIDEIERKLPNVELREKGLKVTEIVNMFNPGYADSQLNESFMNCKAEKPFVYMTKEEKEKVNSIAKDKPFIFMHPFAGKEVRVALSKESYMKIADRIIDEFGLNVVVVGAKYQRKFARGEKLEYTLLDEEFPYERPGLINLVRNTNVRECVSLLQKSFAFIGNWSCYSTTAWMEKIPAITIAPYSRRKGIDYVFNGKFKKRGFSQQLYIGDNDLAASFSRQNDIINEAIENIRTLTDRVNR